MDDETLSGDGLNDSSAAELAFTRQTVAPPSPAPPARSSVGWRIAAGVGVVLLLVAGRYCLTALLESPEATLKAALARHRAAQTLRADFTLGLAASFMGPSANVEQPCEIRYRAPNKLLVAQASQFPRAAQVCDGQNFWFETLAHAYVFKAPAPATLEPLSDAAAAILLSGRHGEPSILTFLLGRVDDKQIQSVTRVKELRGPAAALPKLTGCRVLAVSLGKATATVWIDRRAELFKRVILVVPVDAPGDGEGKRTQGLLRLMNAQVTATTLKIDVDGKVNDNLFAFHPDPKEHVIAASSVADVFKQIERMSLRQQERMSRPRPRSKPSARPHAAPAT